MGLGGDVYSYIISCTYKYQGNVIASKIAWLNINPRVFHSLMEVVLHQVAVLCQTRGGST